MKKPVIVGEEEVHDSSIVQRLADYLVSGEGIRGLGGYLPHRE